MTALRALAAALSALAISSASVALAQTGPQVTAAASPTTSGAIEVVWTPVEAAVGYLVVPQRLTSTGTWVAVDGRTQRVTAVRPVVFDELVNGTTYRGCVAAVLPDGFRTAVSDPAVPYGLPGAPIITETSRDGPELTVTWTPPAANGRPITSYTVAVSPATIQPVVVGGDQTTLTIEGLDDSADYTVTVRATNLRGQGEQVQSETIPAAAALGPIGATVLQVSVVAGPCAGQASSTPPATQNPGSDATAGPSQESDTDSKVSGNAQDKRTPSDSRPSSGPTEVADDDVADDERPVEESAGRDHDVSPTDPGEVAVEPAPIITTAPEDTTPRSTRWVRWSLAGLVLLATGAAMVMGAGSGRHKA